MIRGQTLGSWSFILIIERNQDASRISAIGSEQLIAAEETGGEGRARELHVEDFVNLLLELCFDDRIVKSVGNDFFFLLDKLLVIIFIFLLWIGFQFDLRFLFRLSLSNKFLNMVCKFEFD